MVDGVRARDWSLSRAGRESARAFAHGLNLGTATAVYCSAEPKAVETAAFVAAAAGLPVIVDERLDEHRRGVVTTTDDGESFRERVERVLRHPEVHSFGEESGDQARTRFAAAIADISDRDPERVVVVVSHGTVIALFAEQDVEQRVALWTSLKMPDAVSLK